jgi:SWI/SNF-related matrix-associated actin-dependent regulator of chromatin subfamily A member 5
LLVSLAKYGVGKGDDTYVRIKQEIGEFPAFRFDWFFKSRTSIELARRCTTLITLVEKESDGYKRGAAATNGAAAAAKGKVGFSRLIFRSPRRSCY